MTPTSGVLIVAFVAAAGVVAMVAMGRRVATPCNDYALLTTPDRPLLACDEGATVSFHDTPHGVVFTCTCPAKEAKP